MSRHNQGARQSDDDDGPFEAIPVDPIAPCPEFHPLGDVMNSCARCGWNVEAHQRAQEDR